jgi:glycogen operon protein
MMRRRWRTIWLPLWLAVGLPLGLGCAPADLPRLYRASPLPPSGAQVETTPAMWHQKAAGTRVLVSDELVKNQYLLGPQLVSNERGDFLGVNFSVYSQRAEKMQVLLFDDPESDLPTRQFDMTRRGDVWNVFIEGVGLGQHYGYIAWGPNWRYDPTWFPGSTAGYVTDVDEAGNRFNPNKLLFDPYCTVFHRDHDFAKGSPGTGPFRASVSYGAAMKCRIERSQYRWSPGEQDWQAKRKAGTLAGHGPNDAILYEVHAKGYTANTASGVLHPGTFRGFAEKADYLASLGVNAVELLPPFEKPLDGGYWGYNTLGFFALENTYLSRNDQAFGLDEWKAMVEALHARGIEVIVDVVYNHTGEGGLWRQKIYQTNVAQPWNLDPSETASNYSFRGLDNAAYYALPPTGGREYCDYTAVGNTTRCNGPAMQRLIIDSLRYWVVEMHVDGFRFDLAPALGAKDLAFANCPTSQTKNSNGIQWDPANTLVQAIADDPVLLAHKSRLIAEPWGAGGYHLGGFTASTKGGAGWGEWNGRYRDWWRSFTNDDNWPLNQQQDGSDFGALLSGSQATYGQNGRGPFSSVNFVTCHDGMTLYDILSYDKKVNGCSPLNPVCCTDPLSAFCHEAANSGTDDNRSRNWSAGGPCGAKTCGWMTACYNGECIDAEALKRQLARNFFTAMLVSAGTPMLFGGDEWLRTQLGNNNTYTPEADNSYSWHDWGQWQAQPERWRMVDFVRQLIRVRKRFADVIAPAAYGVMTEASWRNADGSLKQGAAWNNRSIQVLYPAGKAPQGGSHGALALLINFEGTDVNFTLPAGAGWKRLADTQLYFDTPAWLTQQNQSLTSTANATLEQDAVVGNSYLVKSRSMVVLEGP